MPRKRLLPPKTTNAAAPLINGAFYEQARETAHTLFLQGYSLRDIAAQVLPNSKGGYVTVQRWSDKPDEVTGLTWKQEKAELRAEERQVNRTTYLEVVAMVKNRNLRIAALATTAIQLAIEGYFEFDDDGKPVGIKLNGKGNPVISPRDIAPLINAVNQIQTDTLGLATMEREDMEEAVSKDAPVTVNALDIDTVKRMGDWLALQTLEPPDSSQSENSPEEVVDAQPAS